MTDTNPMAPLQIGQVWQQQGNKYGHIHMWEVISIHAKFAMICNMATLKQIVVGVDALSTFTFDNELTEHSGWGVSTNDSY